MIIAWFMKSSKFNNFDVLIFGITMICIGMGFAWLIIL